MTLLFLYSELGPYNIPVLRCLTERHRAQVHVVAWDTKRLKPYIPPAVANVTFYRRSEYSREDLLRLVETLAPEITYVSGWMDADYLRVAKRLRSAGRPVVAGFDDQWRGTLRQRAGVMVFPLSYGRCFSHAWVSGPRQFEFAKRLGFPNRRILFDMLSGDYDLFQEAGARVSAKRPCYPATFLYVGNFRVVKGTDILVRAFRRYRDNCSGGWTLTCAGNGELRYLLEGHRDIRIVEFAAQEDLVALAASAGAFVLPSIQDQWGVVAHEFAAAGLPMILSDGVGAAATFLIDGFNGVMVQGGSESALCDALLRISTASVDTLMEMSANSRSLASRITPAHSAASFLSALESNVRA